MDLGFLGDYKLIKSIGQGTLGSAYLAEHRFMKRQYVVKILPQELSSDRGFIQRFEEEISQISALDHPNIVKIYNVSFAQGQYFLVTDCIVDEMGETTNLAHHIAGRQEPIHEEEIYLILQQVAAPLDYAHAKKIANGEMIHRCLKPNNILIGKRKPKLNIFLSDFGISKIIGSGAVLCKTFKNTSEALGIGMHIVSQRVGEDLYPNPPIDLQKLIPLHASFLQNYAFFAPEQKRLDSSHPITSKVDAYAFGVLAYFLLTNELPEGYFEMPSQKGKVLFRWDFLLQNCLKSHPQNRPNSLTELLESIRIQKEYFVFEAKESVIIENQIVNKESFTDLDIAKYIAYDSLEGQSNQESHQEEMACANFAKTEEQIATSDLSFQTPQTMKPLIESSQLERPQTDLNPGAIFHVHSTVKAYNPEQKDISHIKPILTEMMVITGGNFFRGSHEGSRDEMPKHQVTLASFAIDIHPVTNEQFVRFLEVMGGEKDGNHNDIIRLRDSRIKRNGGKLSVESGYAKHPVVGVTWYGAIAYAKWVGKRLPTEAEWEVAARGKHEGALYPTGDDVEKTQANFFSSDTTSVMSYAPNTYGLYDTAGNVYEWCIDWYGYNYYEISVQEPENPQGPLQGVYRVLRGGCWKSLKEDLRCSKRHRNNPGTVNSTYGFRCAANVYDS